MKTVDGQLRFDVDCAILRSTGDGVLSDEGRKLTVRWYGEFGEVSYDRYEAGPGPSWGQAHFTPGAHGGGP